MRIFTSPPSRYLFCIVLEAPSCSNFDPHRCIAGTCFCAAQPRHRNSAHDRSSRPGKLERRILWFQGRVAEAKHRRHPTSTPIQKSAFSLLLIPRISLALLRGRHVIAILLNVYALQAFIMTLLCLTIKIRHPNGFLSPTNLNVVTPCAWAWSLRNVPACCQ